MSYIKLNLEELQSTRKKIRETFLKQNNINVKVKEKLTVYPAKQRKTRRIFAVDSGFNSAYETNFVLLKAAVVNEEMMVNRSEDIYLFHVNNTQTDRMKRLLMQQSLYEALARTVQSRMADNSLVIVDGTITLSIFYPTLKDSREYKRNFTDFYEQLYSPLMKKCCKQNIIVLGFLKRIASSYLAEHLRKKGTYDIHIVEYLLIEDGQYIGPIPIVRTNPNQAKIRHSYVTFYLNLKNWNYRFELLKEQEQTYRECIENLLFLATETHHGLNPVFSKADEYARVSKREAEIKFDYFTHELDAEERTKLRIEAMRRTHFGYYAKRIAERLPR